MDGCGRATNLPPSRPGLPMSLRPLSQFEGLATTVWSVGWFNVWVLSSMYIYNYIYTYIYIYTHIYIYSTGMIDYDYDGDGDGGDAAADDDDQYQLSALASSSCPRACELKI